jgi:hypothetical protein
MFEKDSSKDDIFETIKPQKKMLHSEKFHWKLIKEMIFFKAIAYNSILNIAAL